MSEKKEKVSLSDVINYEPEKYLSDEEMAIIRSFTPRHLAVIRKVLLPTVADPTLPIEEMGQDVFLQGIDWMTMPAEHVKAIMQGRTEAIKFVIGGIVKMRILANGPAPSPLSQEMRDNQNSSK